MIGFRVLAVAIAAVFGVMGCAASGTKPSDMSASEHERAAAGSEAAARQHGAAFDPKAKSSKDCIGPEEGPCWATTVNPTQEHAALEEREERLAQDHQAAASALRDAEARACAGVSERDRAISPFSRLQDIASVAALNGNVETSVVQGDFAKSQRGAVITFRAVPGLTTQWLQRTVDCHLARNAAMGNDIPEMKDCPLVPKGAHALVRPDAGQFLVEVTGDNGAAAQQIWWRAQLLAKELRQTTAAK